VVGHRVGERLEAHGRAAAVAAQKRDDGGKVAARAVVGHRKPGRIYPSFLPDSRDPHGSGVGVFDRGWVRVFRAAPIGHRDHDCVRPAGQAAAEMVMSVEVVDGPAAAVEVQRHRQPGLGAWPVPAHWDAARRPGDEIVLGFRDLDAGRVDHQLASPGSPGIGDRHGGQGPLTGGFHRL